MIVGQIILGVFLLLVIVLQIRAYYTLRRKNKIITRQSLEIQKQNQILARQNKQLNELNLEKHQIIGVVSHDLKSPFNRIFALLQLMRLSNENLNENQKEYLGKLNQVAMDGLNMVKNLLDSRQLDDNLTEVELETINLDSLIATIINGYNEVAAKKKIKIIAEIPNSIIVFSDRLYIYRIFDNLLSNAIKFSEAGESIKVKLETNADKVSISVIDHGPGISEEDKKKLYRKFQTLTAKPTAGESSTGLGLSIVKSLADRLGAIIECDSKLGEGTNFTVILKKGLVE